MHTRGNITTIVILMAVITAIVLMVVICLSCALCVTGRDNGRGGPAYSTRAYVPHNFQ